MNPIERAKEHKFYEMITGKPLHEKELTTREKYEQGKYLNIAEQAEINGVSPIQGR